MGKYIITFCISTYNRNDGLVKLLDSINDSILSNDFDFTNINVVVVDNFDGLSRNFIQSKTYSFSLDWEHEPKKGLCYARNRTVKMAKETEYLFFVDFLLDENKDFESIINVIKKHTLELRILGTYNKGEKHEH